MKGKTIKEILQLEEAGITPIADDPLKPVSEEKVPFPHPHDDG